MTDENLVPAVPGSKPYVLEEFLAFVRNWVHIPSAHIATMGGRGIEAELWKHVGIPGDNGWLIERNRRLAGNLVEQHPYHVHNSLASFARAYTSVHGPNVHLDAFHLDLCGTLEPRVNAFRNVLPLILGDTEANCLAITVADARRNTSVEDFRSVWYRALKLLGRVHAVPFLRALEAEQKAMPKSHGGEGQEAMDPKKAARREFALFVTLAELLRELPFVPHEMRRYAYVSRTSGSPFRMRTYFFRFAATGHGPVGRSQMFRETWISSPLSFVNKDGTESVRVSPEPIPEKKKEETVTAHVPDPFANLRAAVAHLSSTAQAEFQQLLEEARASGTVVERAAAARDELVTQRDMALRRAKKAEAALSRIQKMLTDEGLVAELITPATATTETPVPPAEPAPAEPLEKKGPKRRVSDAKIVSVQIILLRALAEENKTVQEAHLKNARAVLGLSKKKAGRVLGGLKSRTQKKFRGNFVRRAVETLGNTPALLSELSTLYSRIEGVEVTVAQLELEAQQDAEHPVSSPKKS